MFESVCCEGPMCHNNDFEFYPVGSGSMFFKAGECCDQVRTLRRMLCCYWEGCLKGSKVSDRWTS